MFKPHETAYQVARQNFLAYAAAHEQGCASDEDRATAREQLARTDWLASVIDQLDCLRNHQDQVSDRNAHTRALGDFFALADEATVGDYPDDFKSDKAKAINLVISNATRWRKQIAECGAGFNPLLIASDIVVLQKKIDRILFGHETFRAHQIRDCTPSRIAFCVETTRPTADNAANDAGETVHIAWCAEHKPGSTRMDSLIGPYATLFYATRIANAMNRAIGITQPAATELTGNSLRMARLIAAA
ncbi:hypothetical protein [Thalassospira xiamenensis]|uniref:Uncharacterized protein n=1 Tax=Thalassospira xiamenensis TaxID=220697 RepID=A0ABR5XWI8_9PROT|nr:hypothetical protein [Thalassospira xiamenensis]KZC97209.1 hypothetical protein AUP40_04530 [Thalassospira xiamenensis]KZD10198.1 hypothetical protein AUP45_02680 [Thalassospira xiamenensis]MCD1593154.1 hypothetical protein [Thalassospira xiamenensis]